MRTPDIILEQMLLGEKNKDTDPSVHARLKEMERSNREILEKYPAAAMKQAVSAKIEERKKADVHHFSAISAMRYAGYAAAACLVVTLTIMSVIQRPAVITSEPDTVTMSERIKGNANRMYVYRKSASGVEKLESGDRVAENDFLQLSYLVTDKKWGFIFSIDGDGVITQHYPERGTFSALLESGGEIPLAFSYQLDDAPAFERFVMISSTESFSAQNILESIETSIHSDNFVSRDLSELIPSDMTLTDIVLYK